MLQVRVEAQNLPEPLCPFCKENLGSLDEILYCLVCGTPQHRVCFAENRGACSVYSCNGTKPADKTQNLSFTWLAQLAVVLYCVLNYGAHLFMRTIGPILEQTELRDSFLILMTESFWLLSGFFCLLLFYRITRTRFYDSPASLAAGLILGCNAAFVISLLYAATSNGLNALDALISF